MKKSFLLSLLVLPIILFPSQIVAAELATSNQFCNFTQTGTGSSGQTSGDVVFSAANYPEGCVIYENVNGVSSGNLTIDNTTLVLHKTLTFDPNQKIDIINGGLIWINTGGLIKQIKLCVKDADNDLYADTVAVTTDPNTGLPLTTTVTQIDYAIADANNICPAGYNYKESMNDLSMVDNDVTTNDSSRIVTSDRELLRFGFTLAGVTDALAAAGDVQLINRNLLICTAGSCPTTNFIADSGSLYVAGNVGIGTTSPNSMLNIHGSTPKLTLSNPNSPIDGTLFGQIMSRSSYYNADLANISFEGDGTFNGGIYPTRITLFTTPNAGYGGPVERLRITSSGNVGIGTTTPISVLAVGGNGNASFGIYSETGVYGKSTLSGTGVYGTNDGAGIGVNGSSVSTGTGVYGSNTGSGKGVYGYNSSSGYGVYGQAASTGSGVYGYNTSNGEGVYGYNSATGYGVYGNNPSTGRGVFGNNSSSGQGVYGSSNTGIGGFFTSTSGPALVAYTGNVGIGNNAPGYKLDVLGTTANQQLRVRGASTDVGGLGLLSISNGTGLIFSGATYDSSAWVARNTTASIISLYNGTAQFFVNTGLTSGTAFTPTEAMRVNSDGRVGIGTTTPSAPLTVSTYVSRSTGAVFSGAGSNAAWTTGFTTQNLNTSIAASNVIIGAGIYSVSDKRLKHNIADIPLNQAEKFISTVNPVSFNWNDTGNFDTGFIAQDLISKGFGHLVGTIPNETLEETTDSNGVVSPKGSQYVVNYDSIVPILTTLVKKHETKINEQQNQIDTMKSEINDLQNRLQKIENSLSPNVCH